MAPALPLLTLLLGAFAQTLANDSIWYTHIFTDAANLKSSVTANERTNAITYYKVLLKATNFHFFLAAILGLLLATLVANIAAKRHIRAHVTLFVTVVALGVLSYIRTWPLIASFGKSSKQPILVETTNLREIARCNLLVTAIFLFSMFGYFAEVTTLPEVDAAERSVEDKKKR